MLGAGDATKLAISRKTVCLNDSSKTMGEGLHEILIAITITVEEVAAEIKGIRDKMKRASPSRKEERPIMQITQTRGM